jgi:hypothetical protein
MCGVRVRNAAHPPRKNTPPAHNTVGVAMAKLVQRKERLIRGVHAAERAAVKREGHQHYVAGGSPRNPEA